MFMGAALSASTIAAIAEGCTVDTGDGWTPSFFNDAENQFINELSETMLPKTQTPGAKDALVNRFLDTIRPLRFAEEDNLKYKADIDGLMAKAKTDLGKDFTRATDKEKLDWLTDIDQKSFAMLKANPEITDAEKPFYLSLKEQMLGAYFSSEAVVKEYFAFDPVPGKFSGCIPYADVGRAWAL